MSQMIKRAYRADFDDLPKIEPTYSPRYERPVFALYSNADLSFMLVLYPCATGESVVLEEYGRGTAAPNDADNVGGLAHKRVLRSYLIKKALAGNLTAVSKSAGVTNAAFDTTLFNAAIGAPVAGTSPGFGTYKNGSFGFDDRNVYNVPQSEEVVFSAGADSTVQFIRSEGSSSAVEIHVESGGVYVLQKTVNLQGAGGLRVSVSTEGLVKIVNVAAGFCYVIGVDVDSVTEAKTSRNYDAVMYWREQDIDGVTAYFLGPGYGASDFAIQDIGGRLFGSYHGGHTNEAVQISVGGVAVVAPTVGAFSYGASVTCDSQSDLTSDTNSYAFKQSVHYFDGGHRISVSLLSASPSRIRHAYLGMSCVSERFSKVISPKSIDLTQIATFTEVPLGANVRQSVLADEARGHKVETIVTQMSHGYSQNDGMWVYPRNGDNKVYYSPLRGSKKPSRGFEFSMYHVFRS